MELWDANFPSQESNSTPPRTQIRKPETPVKYRRKRTRPEKTKKINFEDTIFKIEQLLNEGLSREAVILYLETNVDSARFRSHEVMKNLYKKIKLENKKIEVRKEYWGELIDDIMEEKRLKEKKEKEEELIKRYNQEKEKFEENINNLVAEGLYLCPICVYELPNKTLNCTHGICENCFFKLIKTSSEWTKHGIICPLCRHVTFVEIEYSNRF